MTITAKYPGRCSKCGGAIQPGQQIDWDKATKKTMHVTCPAKVAAPKTTAKVVASVATPKVPAPATPPKAALATEGLLETVFNRRTRQEAPPAGYVFRSVKFGQVVTVVKVQSCFISRDDCAEQDDFTFGGSAYWRHVVYCRPATEVEVEPLLAAEAKVAQRKAAAVRLEAIAQQIKAGEYAPKAEGAEDGRNVVEGEILCDSFDASGGGTRFVIADAYIWWIRNNGMDGDDWSRNNVRTGGAGAIGYRLPSTPELAEELRTLAALVAKK